MPESSSSASPLDDSVPQEGAAASGTREVKSAVRTTAALQFLADRFGEPARLREVQDAIGAPRSSTYALLQTLVGEGWVEVDRSGNLYQLGIRALLVGTRYLDADPRVRLVRPIVSEIAERVDETVHLGRLDGEQVVYLAPAESHQYVRRFSRVGRRLPAATTSLGKAILAARGDHAPANIPRLTPHTKTDSELLDQELAASRARGYAIDDEENTEGLRCFGMALHYTDPVVDAISCSVPIERLSPAREQEILEALRWGQRRIEESAPITGW